MAINKNKVQLQETILDSNGHPLSSTDVNPLTSSDCVIMENGMTLEDVMGNDTVIDTPTIMNEDASFKVGIGDSETKVIDSDVAKMVIEGKTYQNILPRPTTLIMNTDEKEFKINDKIDSSIVLDDNVAEIATVKGQTYVNVVQEESASEYVAIDEEINGQSITTTGKPEGMVKNATLEGLTLVNTIQEPSGADATVLELDADIDAQYATIDNTVQGGIHGATLKGLTLVNLMTKCKDEYVVRYNDVNNPNNTVANISMMKPNTEYTLFYKAKYRTTGDGAGTAGGLKIATSIEQGFKSPLHSYTTEYKQYVQKITTSSVVDCFVFASNGSYFAIKECVLLEGDYTQEDIPYFEGMQSVEVPSVKTTGKNLIGGTGYYIGLTGADGATGSQVLTGDGTLKRYSYISECKPNTTYTLTTAGTANRCCIGEFSEYPKLGVKGIKRGNSNNAGTLTITTQPTTNYLVCFCYYRGTAHTQSEMDEIVRGLEVQLEESSVASSYEPYKSSVSTILGANLILDSEKGRYYHHSQGVMDISGNTRYDSYRADVEGLTSVYVKNGHSNYTFWDADMNFIFGVPFVNGLISDGNHNKDGVVNVPSNAKYMRFAYDTVENNGLPCVSEVVTLRKVGDVQDELDLETGKLTQCIGEITLDGSEDENWTTLGLSGSGLSIGFYISINNKKSVIVKCDKLPLTYYDDIVGIKQGGSESVIQIRMTTEYLTSLDLNSFKIWLAQNPLTIQYRLATESVKTVDLTIVDQDNNTLPTIQTHPTLTHVSTSSNGLIPFVTIPSQLKYPTIIKPSTTYTVQLKQTTVNSEFPLTINLGGTTMAVPSTKFTITTPETLTSQDVIFTGKNNVVGEVVITEGDTTGIEYDFFEGMNDVKSPKMIATGKNLLNVGYGRNTASYGGITVNFDANAQTFTVNGTSTYDNICFSISKFSKTMIKGKRYVLSMYLVSGTSDIISFRMNDANWEYTLGNSLGSAQTSKQASLTFEKTVKYIDASIRIDSGKTFNNAVFKMMLEEVASGNATSYEPYKGVTIEQSTDSIPLTSDMFEQGGLVSDPLVIGMSLQQVVKGNGNNTTRIRSKSLISVKPNCKYILNGGLTGWGLGYDKNGGYVATINNIETFTTTSNTYYITPILRISDNSAISPSDLDSMNLILQEVPQEIVLRGIGDVKDELDLTRGEYIQRIGEVVLDGYDSRITMHKEHDNGNISLRISLNGNQVKPIKETLSNSILCDKFKVFTFIQLYQNGNICVAGNMDAIENIYICISSAGLNTSTMKDICKYFEVNPTKIQYVLKTPIVHKVNLTNTKVIPSYATETHYETITPSDSLIPNITIPSTLNYDVAIKPSTEYTIRANTSDNLTVDLGGATGTLSNGKVTLTTPATLTHNEVKFSGTGKVKELMVVEGNKIKDNVPFFNGMKDVQMGGIKLVNIARLNKCSALVTANANKTKFTYTSNGETAYHAIYFDSSLLKTNTVYTVFADITTNTSDNVQPAKFQFGYASGNILDMTRGFVGKIKQTITSPNTTKDGLAIVFRPCSSGGKVVIENPMIIEGDWTHLDEIPFIESEMIIEQPIIRSQGKNLINIPKGVINEWNGATIATNDDGTITLSPNSDNQAAMSYGFYFEQPIKVKTGIAYTYTIERVSGGNNDFSGAINARLKVRKKDGTTTDLSINDITSARFNKAEDKYTFDQDVDGIIGITPIMYGVRNLTSPIIIRCQLEEGSSATSYEPFKQHTLSSNRVIGYEEGCYHDYRDGVKTTFTKNYNSVLADVEGLSIAYVTNTSSNFSFWDKDMVFISGKAFLDTSLSADNKNGFIAVPSNAKYMRFASGNNSGSATYYAKATVTGELPLRSLPSGVCDTLNLVTGEYVQRVGEVVLDGSQKDEYWVYTETNQTFRIQVLDTVQLKDSSSDPLKNKILVSSDKLTSRAYNEDWNSGTFISLAMVKRIVVRIDGITVTSELTRYLKQNPITVQYELETPIVRKIGLTAKGNYREVELNGSETWNCDMNNSNKIQVYIPRYNGQKFYDSVPGTVGGVAFNKYRRDDYHFHVFNVGGNYGFTVVIKPNRLYLADDILSKSFGEVGTLWKQWLSLNPVKVGYLTTNSASLYSNIQKPIFFNDVKVQFMNDNVDIQPTLTLQSTSRNSYVMDMMKANTVYTLKALANPNSFTIDGTPYNATTNGTFTSPSTLTNKLLITGQDVYELMIIEGDVTGKQLPYYKGIRSSFDNTDKVEVFARNKNLVKELYPILNNNTCVIENGVITIKGDGDGSGELNYVFNPSIYLEKDKTYTFSFSSDAQFGKTNGTDTVEAFLLKDGGTGYYIETYGFTKVFTCGATGYYNIRLDINKNNTTHKFYNIQIEESSTATPYQPHKENSTIINMPMQLETVEVVRPIIEVGAIQLQDGQNYDNTNDRRSKDYIPVQPGMTLAFMNGNEYRAENVYLYGINKNYISTMYTNGSGDLIIPKDCYFIRFYSSSANTSDISVVKQQYKPITLNELPNGVKDELIINRATSSAKLIRRVGKVVLDGQEVWGTYTVHDNNVRIQTTLSNCVNRDTASQVYSVCDKLPLVPWNYSWLMNYNLITVNVCNIHLQLADTSLTKQQMLDWLKRNPITVYYELAEPVITEIRLKGYPFVYEDGSISLNTDIAPVTRTSYNVNQHQLINSQNETIIRHDKQISDLYDYIEIYLDEIYRMELFKMQLELSL